MIGVAFALNVSVPRLATSDLDDGIGFEVVHHCGCCGAPPFDATDVVVAVFQ